MDFKKGGFNNMIEINKPFIIAGPCSAESKEQLEASCELIISQNISVLRASLFKPRTRPGFDGIGEKGIQWLKTVTENGVVVATEVLVPDHVSLIRNHIECTDVKKWILWIGSRNQNHLVQRAIAEEMKKQGFDTFLMIKNQPWKDESHWLGIVDHVLSAGFSSNNLILCHRGFSISNNPNNFRNVPDFEMSMKVKDKTGLPMIFDPSHVGGSVQKVFQATKEALNFDFDGFMVEVHPNPNEALTDQRQQLNPEEFTEWINQLKHKKVNPEVADR